MVVEITGEKDTRRHNRRDHARPMHPHQFASDQNAAGGDQHGAHAIQSCIHGGKDAVVGHGYAAGIVLRRLTTMNPARKTTPANPAKTAIEGHKPSAVAGAPAGRRVSRRASMPYVSGLM